MNIVVEAPGWREGGHNPEGADPARKANRAIIHNRYRRRHRRHKHNLINKRRPARHLQRQPQTMARHYVGQRVLGGAVKLLGKSRDDPFAPLGTTAFG